MCLDHVDQRVSLPLVDVTAQCARVQSVACSKLQTQDSLYLSCEGEGKMAVTVRGWFSDS